MSEKSTASVFVKIITSDYVYMPGVVLHEDMPARPPVANFLPYIPLPAPTHGCRYCGRRGITTGNCPGCGAPDEGVL